MSQGLSRNSILYLFASIFFMVLVIWVLLSSASDLYASQARGYIDEWSEIEQPPIASEVKEAMEAINIALNINQNNPAHLGTKALVYEYATKGQPAWDSETTLQLQQALLLYKKSIALRPSWPYVWSAFARVKLKLLEIDDEFENALINMERLGPREPKINLAVVKLGFVTWSQLSKPVKELIRVVVKRSLINQKTHLYRIAKLHNQEQLVYSIEKEMIGGGS